MQIQLKISAASVASVGGVTSDVGAQDNVQPESKASGTDRVTLEKVVLQEEERLRSISAALKLRDLRDLPLEKQVEAIKRAAADAVNQPNGAAAIQDYEERLKAANNGIQQGVAELEQKDKQLVEKDDQLSKKEKQLADKDKQLTEKDKQLTDKDSQIKMLKKKLQTMKLL